MALGRMSASDKGDISRGGVAQFAANVDWADGYETLQLNVVLEVKKGSGWVVAIPAAEGDGGVAGSDHGL